MLRVADRLEFTPSRSPAFKIRKALPAEAVVCSDRARGIWRHVGRLLRRGADNTHPQVPGIFSLDMIALEIQAVFRNVIYIYIYIY